MGVRSSAPRRESAVFPRSLVAVVCLWSGLGCGVLSTTQELPSSAPLLTASRGELIETVRRIARIESLKAVTDTTLTLQTEDRTEETRYRNVRGALVTRRPAWIRTYGETPGGIAKVYDMVSDGKKFQVHVPWQNRVYEGSNALNQIDTNRFKNLRPQHILDAIMLTPVDDAGEVLLDVETYGSAGYQVLLQIERNEDGEPLIRRKFWFNRSDLQLARLMILDDRTEVVTDAWYREWQEDNGLPFPRFIRIERPQDGYELEIEILRPGVNAEIPDESFELALPGNIEVQSISDEPSSAS